MCVRGVDERGKVYITIDGIVGLRGSIGRRGLAVS